MSSDIVVAVIGVVGLIIEGLILKKQSKAAKQQEDAHKRTELLLEGVEASLVGLKQLGANGRVSECLKNLETFKNKKAAD